jgi:hypothetical protein
MFPGDPAVSKILTVPEGYRCPLCPDHEDDAFVWSAVMKAPVCRGCSHDILNLVTDEERLQDSVLDRIEALTGLTYHEYQILELESAILSWTKSLSSEELLAIKKERNWTEDQIREHVAEIQGYLGKYKGLIAFAQTRLAR